ncbi:MAG: cyclic nucleotide-binding domain-containing protein [Acidimicrobiia bacterium]
MTKRERTNPTLRCLERIDFFRSCDARQLSQLLPNADVTDVPPGTTIAHAGSSVRQFIGIVDGYVETLDEHGQPTVLGPGDQIGARELLDDSVHPVTAVTLTRATLVAVFGPPFRWAAHDLDVDAALSRSTSSPAIHELAPVG